VLGLSHHGQQGVRTVTTAAEQLDALLDLDDMSVPVNRRDLTNIGNLTWLQRNLPIGRRFDDPNLAAAMNLTRQLIKEFCA